MAHAGKKEQSLDPCRPGRKYCTVVLCVLQAKRRKKHDPWPSEFEMNMAAWATRLIPFGMQEGYIHHAEGADVQKWNRGTLLWMVAARRPESI